VLLPAVGGAPPGLASIHTGAGAAVAAAAGLDSAPPDVASPHGDLAAESNLTVVGESAALTDGAAELAVPSAPAAEPDWRAAFRVPLFTPEGRLMGYRQNSSLLGGRPPGASPPLSPCSLDPDSPKCISPTTVDADFAGAASDPLKSFPSAGDVVPGYLLGPVLGRGGFCTVRKALHQATGLAAAVKIIDKARLGDPKDRDRVDREVRVMRQLAGHVGVVQLLECVETEHCLYIVMEECRGG